MWWFVNFWRLISVWDDKQMWAPDLYVSLAAGFLLELEIRHLGPDVEGLSHGHVHVPPVHELPFTNFQKEDSSYFLVLQIYFQLH